MLATLALAALATVSAAETNSPPVQMLVLGLAVRELPVPLSYQNNVEHAPDGRLFAADYDGRPV